MRVRETVERAAPNAGSPIFSVTREYHTLRGILARSGKQTHHSHRLGLSLEIRLIP